MTPTTSILEAGPQLPHGPHSIPREEIAASQRARLMRALAELLAGGGWSGVTIGALAKRAGVSRAAFYEHFESKEECLLTTYDTFAVALVERMTGELDAEADWSSFVDATLAGYLGALQADPVAAKAFVVELEGCGPRARRRRREAVHGFAAIIGQRHAAMRERDPKLGPLPERVYLGIALGVRELVRETLEDRPDVPVTELAPDIVLWLTAVVEGAPAAG